MNLSPRALGLTLALCFSSAVFAASDRVVVPLWPNGAPGSEARKDEPEKIAANGSVSNIHNPTLTVYLPPKDKATGVAVIVAPGGGHGFHSIEHEGYSVGEWLAEHGIAGFVLKYRLARDNANPPGKPQPYTIEGTALSDAQRAIRMIRSKAKEWNVDPAKVGILGFSAGGEVALFASNPAALAIAWPARPNNTKAGDAAAKGGAPAAAPAPAPVAPPVDLTPDPAKLAAAIKAQAGKPDSADPIERESAHPDFQALLYPGTSQKTIPSKESPPIFLAAGYKDRPDISEGLPKVYLRFKEVGVPADLHMYASAGHGFGLRATNKTPSGAWPERFREWLIDQKFIAAAP